VRNKCEIRVCLGTGITSRYQLAGKRHLFGVDADGSFTGDIRIAGRYTAEVKARSNGQRFRMLEAWLGRGLLILKRDRRSPTMVMDFHAYARLLRSALRKP